MKEKYIFLFQLNLENNYLIAHSLFLFKMSFIFHKHPKKKVLYKLTVNTGRKETSKLW